MKDARLDEVIIELGFIIDDSTMYDTCENCGEETESFRPSKSDLKEIHSTLRELNQPVQYVVTLTKSGETSSLNSEEYVSAQINGVNLFY